nr:hypothetical protein BHI3_28020 [Bacteriovorax sp. HI3]
MTAFIRSMKALGIVSLFLNLAQATELWTRSQLTSRNYLSIERTDEALKLNHFYQEKGEFQTLIGSYSFKKKAEIEAYVLKNFPAYKPTEKLVAWPIQAKLEKEQNKLFGGKKNEYIWLAKNQWNDDWEKKYSEWLQNEVTPEFFKKYKIQTDCADALVGLRWIFARMNYLPVANTVADTGGLFGHFSMKKEWRKYDTAANWYDDELFMAALDYIMNLTSTRTVINDGFPVRLDKEGLVAGTFIITQNNGSGHAKIITETHYEEVTELPLYTLASTSPRALRVLTKEVFLDQDWPFKGNKEILAFRWPVVVNSSWVLQKKDARPTYSEEQFSDDLKADFPAFIQFVLSRVKGSYDPLKLVDLAVKDILNYADQRIQVVTKGYEYCKRNDCRPGTQGDDDWGTPSRDSKLLKKFHDIDMLVKEFENLSPGLNDQWIAGLRNATLIVEGVPLKLSSLRFIMENGLYSSNGSDTPLRRWGLNADELMTKWMASSEKLLNEREAVISRPENPCSKDCYPKTNLWVGLSTYHIDAELNQLYTQITTYCTLIEPKACQNFFSSKAQKAMVFNGETKSLESWFKLIPFFHSDPRASIARRWGELPQNIRARALPYFDTIKISKNSLALLDTTKLMDLKTGKILFEASRESRIILTDVGVVYKINDAKGIIFRLNLENLSWVQIADPDNILSLEMQRQLYVQEDNGYTIFLKPLSNGQIIFRINDDRIEFIKEYQGAGHQLGTLVTTALDKNTMSFIDLDRTLNIDITVPSSSSFYDMNLVSISSYNYPEAVLEYRDRDQDIYYSVLVNLEKKSWTRIAPSIDERSSLLWSDVRLRKALIQTKFNDEFPQVYAVSWDLFSQFQVQKMNNLLLGTKISGDTVYFIDGTGGVWDQNPKTKLIEWGKKLVELPGPANSEVKFLTSLGAYFSSDETGTLRTLGSVLGEPKSFRLPKDLLPENEFCQIQTKTEDIFSFRFSPSYGDYSCMGGSLLKSEISTSKDELVPQFSHYSWINKESLLDLRWHQTFAEFDVQKGLLIGLGKNIGLWWDEKTE